MAPHISIVTSLYRSEGTVAEFIRRADAAARAITPDYEIILVNDGSPDRTREITVEAIKAYPSCTLIDLSRNFGQLSAIHAGLTYAKGDYIFALDSDLEEAPELLDTFYKQIKSSPGIDVVYGIQKSRNDPILRAMTSSLFYFVFQRMTGVRDLKNMLILRIMTRRFLDAYLTLGDYHLFVAGISHYTGFEKQTLLVEKDYKGHSSYSFRKRLTMAGDAILSFSTYPLYTLFVGSLVLALAMVVVALLVLARKATSVDFQAGWASLIVSVWLVGAMIINSLAIVGLYIAKIFEQVKRRPRFIVRQIYKAGGTP